MLFDQLTPDAKISSKAKLDGLMNLRGREKPSKVKPTKLSKLLDSIIKKEQD